MSNIKNLHGYLHEIADTQIHYPKHFYFDASAGMLAYKDYRNEMRWDYLPKERPVLDIVDGSLAPPTEAQGDRYILVLLTGSVTHADWDGADFNDIVEFFAVDENNTALASPAWYKISPYTNCIIHVKDVYKDYIYEGSAGWVDFTGSGGGGGITSLNGLSGASQTFANDTNIGMTSVGTTHTINWIGTLAATRGGTGFNTTAKGDILAGAAGNTWVQTAVGVNGTVLTADSSKSGGVAWTAIVESDPVFSASAAFGITAGKISDWNTAYGWGDHAGLYDLIGEIHGLSVAAPVAGDNLKFLQYIHAGTSYVWTAAGGGTPAGGDTQVQFNDGGSAFGADAKFVFLKATDYLGVGLTTPTATAHFQGETADDTKYWFKGQNSTPTVLMQCKNDGYVQWTNINSYNITFYNKGSFEIKKASDVANTLTDSRSDMIIGYGNTIGSASYYSNNNLIFGYNNIIAGSADTVRGLIVGDGNQIRRGSRNIILGSTIDIQYGNDNIGIGDSHTFSGSTYNNRIGIGYVCSLYNATREIAIGDYVGLNNRTQSQIMGSGDSSSGSLIATSAYPRGVYFGTGTDAPTFGVVLPVSGAGAGKSNNIGLGYAMLALLDTASTGEGAFWVENAGVEPSANLANSVAYYVKNGLPYWRDKDGLTHHADAGLYTSTADATVGNTTTETSVIGTGVGTVTLPANFLRVGKKIKLNAWGYYSTRAVATTITTKVYLGATEIWSSGAVIPPTGVSNIKMQYLLDITCRTVGAGGTVMVQGACQLNDGSALNTLRQCPAVYTATTAVDTTAAKTIDIKVTWGHADVSSTITITSFDIQTLNNI